MGVTVFGSVLCCFLSISQFYWNVYGSYYEPIDFRDTPTVQTGVEGQDVALRCEVSGRSTISWIVPDGNLTNPKYEIIGDGLLIRNVSRDDSDQVYLCEASQSNTGELKRVNITLIVEHPPVPEVNADTGEVYAQDDEVYGFLDETLNLTCAVRANPPPKFEWFRKRRAELPGIKMTNHNSFMEVHITKYSTGEYSCIASNEHGQLEKIFNLRIGKRPEPPGNITLENATCDSLMLNVELPKVSEEDFQDNMQPIWLIIQYRKESSEKWWSLDLNLNITEDEQLLSTDDPLSNFTIVETFTLSELEAGTKYEVMAATKNIASLSNYTEPAFFETLPSSTMSKQLCYLALFFNFFIIVMFVTD